MLFKKSIICFLMASYLQVFSTSQVIEIKDPVLKAALLTRYDTGGDAEISLSEARAATGDLVLKGLQIRSLEGIEHFVNLIRIDCSQNKIKALPNLSTLEKLADLDISNNALVSLNQLPVAALRRLNCNNNHLTSLPDLSGMEALEFLDCSENQLVKLGELPHPNLTILKCAKNKLTGLPPLPGLLFFLDCSNNPLKRLPDLSHLSQLTYLYCPKKPLAQVPDLSGLQHLVVKGTDPRSTEPKQKSHHIPTPDSVKAIYMSSWVAGTPSIRGRLLKLINSTELNAIVIDVKDNTGTLSWEGRILDLPDLIKELHDHGIYVIGRIAAFQDPLLVSTRPDLAVQNKASCLTWRDHEGNPWIDTGSKEMWEFLVDVGHQAYDMGFDELNYDYIRFATDGALAEMAFPISGARALVDKQGIVRDFFKYLHDQFGPQCIPISGDIFGILMATSGDIPILGQSLLDALVYFDYVAPMVYPSHFMAWTDGWENPAEHPGEIIEYAFKQAAPTLFEVGLQTGLSQEDIQAKIRPWYQDFDMGATYTAELVRAQIEAGEKYGATSWMLWDPGNHYTPEALKPEEKEAKRPVN